MGKGERGRIRIPSPHFHHGTHVLCDLVVWMSSTTTMMSGSLSRVSRKRSLPERSRSTATGGGEAEAAAPATGAGAGACAFPSSGAAGPSSMCTGRDLVVDPKKVALFWSYSVTEAQSSRRAGGLPARGGASARPRTAYARSRVESGRRRRAI